jgi:hypothetical protein
MINVDMALTIAITNHEWHTCAFMLDAIAEDYFETGCENALSTFNKYFTILPVRGLVILIRDSQFEEIKGIAGKRIDQLKSVKYKG